MINRVTSSIIPKAATVLANNTGKKGDKLTKFMKNPILGKVLDSAGENPVICQSAFSLALCCVARPITNYAVTKDKKDAGYASAHSIASGTMGFIWPMIFATPLACGVKAIAKNPQKYLKPERIKQFYPNVKIIEEVGEAGKKIKKIATNEAGQMLRKDGSVLCQSLEPKMIYGEAERAAFESKNAGFYVDKGGVVRSKSVFKTENGVLKLDKDGNKIGCAVQEDLTPITEEMELGVKKEENVKNFLNMVPDIILAPPRAFLTIKLIPPILGALGIQKSPKGGAANQQMNVVSNSNNTTTRSFVSPNSPFAAFKKGGV
jgi:hypothetical protein